MHQMTTGAGNDFERATDDGAQHGHRATACRDALGPMVYAENEGEVFLGRSITTQKNVSEATMQKVDLEIRRIIDEQYALARKLHRGQPRQGRGDWRKPCSSGKRSTASRSRTSCRVGRRAAQAFDLAGRHLPSALTPVPTPRHP